MTPYFASEGRIAILRKDAAEWLLTPWMPNSYAKGAGVSCHNLPHQLYLASGFFTDKTPRIVGDPNGSKHTKVSVIEKHLDAQPNFLRLKLDVPRVGDLVGIRIRGCIDHLGVVLDQEKFIHVLMHKKTCIDSWRVSPWMNRINAVWRPIE